MPEKKAAEKSATEGEAEEKKGGMTEMVRRVLFASVGTVVLAQEEIEDFVNRLVDKGEIAEKDGRKLIKETMDRRRKQTAKVEKEVDDRAEGIAEKVLARMNVPTKSDIEVLSAKISDLSQKVEDLKQHPA